MSDMTSQSECLSDLLIDEALSDELPMAIRIELEQHLATCSRCRNQWGEIAKEREAFLSKAPSFEALSARVARAPTIASSFRIKPWLAGFAVATATAATVVVMLVQQPAQPVESEKTNHGVRTDSQAPIGTRGKGSPALGFFIKRGNKVSEGQSGAVVRPGDLIRFTYTSDTARYLALFNLDAERVSIYYPEGSRAERVAAGHEIALDFSVELDQTIGRENIFAVFCEKPFELEPMRQELADTKRIAPGSGCTLDTIELVKEPEP